MDPKIIFEDDCLLVLDKPAGMIVNKAETTVNLVTVQDWVGGYLIIGKVSKVPKVSKVESEKVSDTSDTFSSFDAFYDRAGIVHRLDKETSGILLVAKTPESFVELQRQFKERIVKKTYLSLVHGEVKPTEGVINAPVGRLPWNRERFGVFPGGRDAVTRYKTVFSLQDSGFSERYTLLELNPETGRTHQIRVHMKYLGYPLVGDEFYAGRKTARNDRKWCSRIFLHAHRISFIHPQTGKQVEFVSELPEDLKLSLEKLSGK